MNASDEVCTKHGGLVSEYNKVVSPAKEKAVFSLWYVHFLAIHCVMCSLRGHPSLKNMTEGGLILISTSKSRFSF